MSCAHKNPENNKTNVISPDAKPKGAGTVLTFTEKKRNETESLVRLIITDNFLRIDDGKDSNDYVLFHRKNKIIYNVVEDDKSVMVIRPKLKSYDAIKSIKWEINSQQSNAVMRSEKTSTNSVMHYEIRLDGKKCYNVVSIDNFLSDELNAIKEYRRSLANELYSNFRPEEGERCYEAINILDPLHHLQFGFPIREWSAYGYQRFLVNYNENIIFPESLFTVPKNYMQFSL